MVGIEQWTRFVNSVDTRSVLLDSRRARWRWWDREVYRANLRECCVLTHGTIDYMTCGGLPFILSVS